MGFLIKCMECEKKFSWKVDTPSFCPNCGVRFGSDRPDDDVVMPAFLSTKTRSNDNLYRQMEAGSEFRAQAAAEMAGVPVSEMSSLKITNLSDRRDVEIAAMPVANPVTQFMAQNRVGGFQGDGIGYSAAVQTGPSPNMGARMRTALQNSHSEMVARHAVGIGETGRPVTPSTDVTSDRPAKETMQPGYRRRG